MHDAYEVTRILTTTGQIETIAAYDCNLLLGTRQGHLLMYSITAGNSSQKYNVQLLQYNRTFSKKPIQQLEVIPEYNLLVCLTDNILSTYNITTINCTLDCTLSKTKGASLFALDNKSTASLTGEVTPVIRLCVAVKRKLQLYYWKNGKFVLHLEEITIPDIPKVMSWGQQYICVGFKGEYTFFDLQGKPKELFPTSSSKSIDPTIEKYSDICFMLGRDQTSVLVEEGKTVENMKTIKWLEAPVAIVWDEPYILGLLTDQIVVQTVEPNIFIQTLGDLNKARLVYRCRKGFIYIASISQVWCIQAVDITKQRQMLLKDCNFQLAVKLTNISDETEEEKKQKINSIQMLYALNLFDNKKYSESMEEFIKLNTDPSEVIRLFPELAITPNKSSTSEPSSNGKELQGKDLEEGVLALIEYLIRVRLQINEENKELTKNANEQQDANKGGPLISESEAKLKVKKNMSILETIDTTLLKCYLLTNDAFVAPLLRLNHCKLEEAEHILMQHGKHSELIILYQTKGQHTKALQLLKEQAKQQDSSLKGHHRTKNYLQNLGAEHLNLIFQFSDWVLKEHPEEGLKIFIDDITEVENLPRPKVLDFLLREHDSLVIPYLEHIIHSWNDTNSFFHNALIKMYLEKIVNKKTDTSEDEIQHTKSKLLAFLEESQYYTPENVLLLLPTNCLFEERAIVLGKLNKHEQALSIYVYILGDVNRGVKYCDSVYEKSPEENQNVYVLLMRMLLSPMQKNIFTGPLANVPIDPKTSQPDLEMALLILEKHADKIQPLQALSVLPDSVLLGRIKKFLSSAIDNQLSLRRKTQVLKGLLYAEHMQVQEQRIYHESQSVIINDYNVCPVCKKRFGNQSAFVRYPNGDIVHYSCHQP